MAGEVSGVHKLESVSSVNFFDPYGNLPMPLNFRWNEGCDMVNEWPTLIPDPAAAVAAVNADPLVLPNASDDDDAWNNQHESKPSMMMMMSNLSPLPRQQQRHQSPVLRSPDLPFDGAQEHLPMYSINAGTKRKRDDLDEPPWKMSHIGNTSGVDAFPDGSEDGTVLHSCFLMLRQMQPAHWPSYRQLHVELQDEPLAATHTEEKLQASFHKLLAQWSTQGIGPFAIYCLEGERRHFAGFLKFLVSLDTSEDGGQHVCLHVRLTLLRCYSHQRRVMNEAVGVALEWMLRQKLLLNETCDEICMPTEICASRTNALRTTSFDCNDPRIVVVNAHECIEAQDGGQQQMVRMKTRDLSELIGRLEQQLSGSGSVPHIINEDIWSTRSEKGTFEMRVMWEIPLLKFEENTEIRLYMSTYHDTPVQTELSDALLDVLAGEPHALYKMRLDLCQVDAYCSMSDAPERCCRIKTQDVADGQRTLMFNGVRKSKVGDKNKVYVIRCQLWRTFDDNATLELLDTCYSRPCQLTSSRRAYRVADEQPPSESPTSSSSLSPSPQRVGKSLQWKSRSGLATVFGESARFGWKPGFAKWLYTQEKVLFEVDNVVPGAFRMKLQFIDVQSNLPVRLVAMSQGAKTSSKVLFGTRSADYRHWSVDLRVYSKKEVQNRLCYLHVVFTDDQDTPLADFTSAFVVNVGTTYTNLKKLHHFAID